MVNGILNVFKPSGPTSFAVVARVRKLTGISKVGHGGTLDPMACGVLPVFLGQATRLAEYLMESHKTYRASVMLGTATDSYDAEGAVTEHGDTSNITGASVKSALDAFRGEIRQTPPEYSAIKHKGQPLYKLARAGCHVDIPSRLVTIYRLEMLKFAPPLVELEIECSKGTYIRSLAHDLGQILGCGAHLSGLVRTSYGPFDIKQSVSLEQLEIAVADASWNCLVQPMDIVLSMRVPVMLSDAQVEVVRCGGALDLQVAAGVTYLRAYDGENRFIAVLAYDADAMVWHPKKVFNKYV